MNRNASKSRTWPAALVVLGVLFVDQLTKWTIVELVMQPPRVIEVAPFLNIVLGFNKGMSFGLFRDALAPFPEAFALAKLGIVAVVAWLLARSDDGLEKIAFGLIIGGALGNIVDRLRLGGVVDFLDLHATGRHWPSFNAADVALTAGAVLMIAAICVERRRASESTPH